MQVIDDGAPVDALLSVVKESVAQAGVSGPGPLRVVSVQLTLQVMGPSGA